MSYIDNMSNITNPSKKPFAASVASGVGLLLWVAAIDEKAAHYTREEANTIAAIGAVIAGGVVIACQKAGEKLGELYQKKYAPQVPVEDARYTGKKIGGVAGIVVGISVGAAAAFGFINNNREFQISTPLTQTNTQPTKLAAYTPTMR